MITFGGGAAIIRNTSGMLPFPTVRDSVAVALSAGKFADQNILSGWQLNAKPVTIMPVNSLSVSIVDFSGNLNILACCI
jgi:hypothetical protein